MSRINCSVHICRVGLLAAFPADAHLGSILELRIGVGKARAGSSPTGTMGRSGSPTRTMLGGVVDLDNLNHCYVQHVPLVSRSACQADWQWQDWKRQRWNEASLQFSMIAIHESIQPFSKSDDEQI